MEYDKVKDKLEQYEKDGNYPKLKKGLLILFDVSKCPECKSEDFKIDNLYNNCNKCYHIWQARDCL